MGQILKKKSTTKLLGDIQPLTGKSNGIDVSLIKKTDDTIASTDVPTKKTFLEKIQDGAKVAGAVIAGVVTVSTGIQAIKQSKGVDEVANTDSENKDGSSNTDSNANDTTILPKKKNYTIYIIGGIAFIAVVGIGLYLASKHKKS